MSDKQPRYHHHLFPPVEGVENINMTDFDLLSGDERIGYTTDLYTQLKRYFVFFTKITTNINELDCYLEKIKQIIEICAMLNQEYCNVLEGKFCIKVCENILQEFEEMTKQLSEISYPIITTNLIAVGNVQRFSLSFISSENPMQLDEFSCISPERKEIYLQFLYTNFLMYHHQHAIRCMQNIRKNLDLGFMQAKIEKAKDDKFEVANIIIALSEQPRHDG